MSIRYNGQKIAGKYKVNTLKHSTTEDYGIIKLATQDEVNAGINDTNAVTPNTLNTKLDTELSSKQDVLTAGDNINITKDDTTGITTISAQDTKYTSGEGIDITDGVISNTRVSAEWGNITGDITSQNDLQDVLNSKVDTNYLTTQLNTKQDVLVAGNGIEIDTTNNTISGTTVTFRDWSI